jgi:hypothetical protein
MCCAPVVVAPQFSSPAEKRGRGLQWIEGRRPSLWFKRPGAQAEAFVKDLSDL